MAVLLEGIKPLWNGWLMQSTVCVLNYVYFKSDHKCFFHSCPADKVLFSTLQSKESVQPDG